MHPMMLECGSDDTPNQAVLSEVALDEVNSIFLDMNYQYCFLFSSLAVKDGKTWRKLKFVVERSTALSAKGTEHF